MQEELSTEIKGKKRTAGGIPVTQDAKKPVDWLGLLKEVGSTVLVIGLTGIATGYAMSLGAELFRFTLKRSPENNVIPFRKQA